MNEGWATFWHYTLLNRLHEKGLVTDGFMIEVLKSHTNVVFQPPFDAKYYSGINPYALGYAMFTDLRRICERPDAEDKQFFPQLAGSDWKKSLDFAMRNFKDESFIAQYLSPRLIREFRLFAISDHESQSDLGIDSIHNEAGYKRVRKLLASQHSMEERVPDIQVRRYSHDGDRSLTLQYKQHRGRPLSEAAGEVLKHVRFMWGFPVKLEYLGQDESVLETRQIA
jgi:spore cortex formation protein SpoVR/YcgB (stage V sporulation)